MYPEGPYLEDLAQFVVKKGRQEQEEEEKKHHPILFN